ncbi:monocarboxylate transporter 3-like isoform X2 [Vanessa tameamea]|uniref:Monocarboxylate transporter 3-like isoform X2 n=1 Tax=Vanessa tameamea TaxID=334116 RepID=A0ABM4AQB9_VANTA|nr:monocarboxylate transporter 3-like isoform X2 [Vanessa tameamea]XP_046969523.1 monocarboxylate transporter 3-like isoform X2 [Vanessa cardui]
MEAGWWSPSPSASPPPPPRAPPPRCRCRPLSNSYNCLPHYDGWPDLEDESTGGALRERELRSLHRTVPALRRRELDTRAIKHHFYPEGGWGWIVCGAAFLAHLLSTGLQLAYGALHVYALRHLGPAADHAVWAGAICVGVSRAAGALVSARRKSPRLAALVGGLLLPLACLFTSFATQLHQTLLSYGVVLGVGCGLVREAAGLVLGTYFRRRRQFVELVAHTGGGVGIALFSVAYKEAVGKLGWRLGLQAVTGVLVLAFFLSAAYRSASLYHPQRRAILHLKNQRRKVKEKKGLKTPPFIDLSPLHSRSAKVLLLSAGLAAFGLYTPVFFLALQGFQEGLEESALVLLQTFLGFAAVLGCAGFGLVLVRPSAQCLVSKQYLCQTAMLGIGISMLALSSVEGYHGYVLFAWMYGLCLGGFLYSMKMLTMERVRGRHFTKVWSFVQGAEAIPVIVGVPMTGFSKRDPEPPPPVPAPTISEACLCMTPPPRCEPAWCACSAGGATAYCAWPGPTCSSRLPKSLSYAAPLNRTCCTPHYPECCRRAALLRPSRSVPEGLARRGSTFSRSGSCKAPCHRREHHLIEQITTSV